MTRKHRTLSRNTRYMAAATTMCFTACLTAPMASAAPEPSNLHATPARTSISFTHSLTGFQVGTPNEHESRSALSIAKLYIADYVYDHGTDEDRDLAYHMLQTSDDGIASTLYARHPGSIAATSQKYGLNDTHAAPHWGYSTTSTYDSTMFLEARKRDHGIDDPILTALATATPVAADGYRQDYGTAWLPGVIGTKWGWSDDRASLHASASYGTDFSVTAHTYGPAAQLTADVLGAFPSWVVETPPPPAETPPQTEEPPVLTPVHQVISDATGAAHAAVNNTAGKVASVPGSSDTAATGAALAHQGIDGLAGQASRLADRAGF